MSSWSAQRGVATYQCRCTVAPKDPYSASARSQYILGFSSRPVLSQATHHLASHPCGSCWTCGLLMPVDESLNLGFYCFDSIALFGRPVNSVCGTSCANDVAVRCSRGELSSSLPPVMISTLVAVTRRIGGYRRYGN